VDEAADFFSSLPRAAAILKSMQDVGLGYLHLNRRAHTLSGGESQRIKIAAELAKAPAWKLAEDGKRALFILDEPTSGLDPAARAEVHKMLAELLQRGTTVFLTTHDMAEAETVCDRVAILADGAIAACDDPDELKLRYARNRIAVRPRTRGTL